jgi:hypothetical protein
VRERVDEERKRGETKRGRKRRITAQKRGKGN